MQGTVEVVTKTGKGFRIVGQTPGEYYNRGKKLDEDVIPNLKKGDSIEFDAQDGKWVNSIKMIDGPVAPQNATPLSSKEMDKVFGGATKTYPTKSHDGATEDSNSIARGCAANAVLGSPYIATLLNGGCEEETVKNVKDFMGHVAKFVYGGSW